MPLPQYRNKSYNIAIPTYVSKKELVDKFKITAELVDTLLASYIISSRKSIGQHPATPRGILLYNYKEFRKALKLQLISLKEIGNIYNIYTEKVNSIIKDYNIDIITISVMKYVFINDIKFVNWQSKPKYDDKLTDIRFLDGQFTEPENGYEIFLTLTGEKIRCKLFNTAKIDTYQYATSLKGGSHPLDKDQSVFYIL